MSKLQAAPHTSDVAAIKKVDTSKVKCRITLNYKTTVTCAIVLFVTLPCTDFCTLCSAGQDQAEHWIHGELYFCLVAFPVLSVCTCYLLFSVMMLHYCM